MPTLRDLGVTTSAASNATGPTQGGPDLTSLLQQLSSLPAQEAVQSQQALEQVQGQETPGLLQQLLSPRGLALALGTLLASKEAGGVGAAAFGLGGLQSMEAKVAAGKQTQADAIEKLQDQRDKALDRVEKAQQRASNLFNTNPDAFIDPETGEPTMSAEDIGLITTGFPIRVFPQTRRKLDEDTAAKEARHEIYVEALKNATSVEQARMIFRHIFQNQGWQNPPDAVADALAKSAGTEGWTATLANIIAQNATNAPDVFIHAAESGMPLEDASVWRLVEWRDKPVEVPTETAQKAMLLQKYNQWLQQNSDQAAKIRKASINDTEFLQATMDEAFADEPGSAQQLKVWLKVNEDPMQFIEAYQEYAINYELAAKLAGFENLDSVKQMSEEERARFLARGTIEVQKARKQEVLDALSAQDAAWRNRIKDRIQKEFNLGPTSTTNIAEEVFRRAAEASVRPDGHLDRAKFEKAVEAELQKVREELGG